MQVWFKGALTMVGFEEGFTCTFDETRSVNRKSSYVTCRVPNWRVLTKDQKTYTSPLIPDKAIWKII